MLKFNLIIIALVFAFMGNVAAYELKVNARAAALYHPATDTYPFEFNGDLPMEPASLVKLMTLYVLFEALQKQELSLDSELPISAAAWQKGGSKMFLEVGKTVKVQDLIRGIAISSGNDACLVVAEYLGGTEDHFAVMMNAKGEQLGLQQTTFRNASGWPHPEQVVSAKDMLKIAAALQRDFPEYYPYFSETQFTYNQITQQNRNGLLKRNVGVDGMKTGHTETAGFHLVASGVQDGTRLLAVVLGTDSFNAREGETLKILRYGWAQLQTKTLWQTGQQLARARVWLGAQAQVNLVAGESRQVFVPRTLARPKLEITYAEPIPAPVAAGQVVGEARVTVGGAQYITPLVASEAVPMANVAAMMTQKLFHRLGL